MGPRGAAASLSDRVGESIAYAMVLCCLLLLSQAATEPAPPTPASLPRAAYPRLNPYTKAKAELGRALFFDARLSGDGKTACVNCHVPVRAFGSSRAVPPMAAGREGLRHAPSLINRAFGKSFGWAGQYDSLESAIAAHFEARGIMDRTLEQAVAAIGQVAGYAPLVSAAFGAAPLDELNLRRALATWVRTLVSGDGPYDRFMSGTRAAISESAARGKELFFGKANCIACHAPPLFGADAFASNGAGTQNPPDPGRQQVTNNERDYRLFRVPGLRDIARSAPYFHDGSVDSLAEVVAFYDRGGELSDNPDPRLKPLRLSEQEKRDLVEFLESLNGEGWQAAVTPPGLPQ